MFGSLEIGMVFGYNIASAVDYNHSLHSTVLLYYVIIALEALLL